jgi:8-oxo-dGTP pyrophosphatase MutT (NUDIX family)
LAKLKGDTRRREARLFRDRIRIAFGKVLKHQRQHELSAESPKLSAAKVRRDGAIRKPGAARRAGLQYAALPYRLGDDLEILLISSRETGRWVLPKGWPIKGKKAHAAAAREALEEAGMKGRIGKAAIGRYSYGKRLLNGAVLACTVEVYPLAVERQLKRWPEQGQRSLGWFSPRDAADQVEEAELASLIMAFAGNMAG